MENGRKRKNIVIFGESGVGKSSTVNTLLGQQVAEISDSAVGCTFEYKQYIIQNGSNLHGILNIGNNDETIYECAIYDTVGLSEGDYGTVASSAAYDNLANLMWSIRTGISLLVFVMKKGRITESMSKSYNFFVEYICSNKVPVILLITHCESKKDKLNWWNENRSNFDKYGMRFSEVVSGCTTNGVDAEEPFKEFFETANKITELELREAIGVHALREGWNMAVEFNLNETKNECDATVLPGDLIQVNRHLYLYSHWALYIGDGFVIHLTAITESGGKAQTVIVKQEKLIDVVKTDAWWYWRHTSPIPIPTIIERAKADIGSEKNYSITKSNCEHQVNLWKYGHSFSKEVGHRTSHWVYGAGMVTVLVGISCFALPVAGPIVMICGAAVAGLGSSVKLTNELVHNIKYQLFGRRYFVGNKHSILG